MELRNYTATTIAYFPDDGVVLANGWIKAPVSGSSLGTPVVYGEITGDWCYEEVRIPRALIGATAAGTSAIGASMSWYPLGRTEITLN